MAALKESAITAFAYTDRFLSFAADGNKHATVSARVGYYEALRLERRGNSVFWMTCRRLIDWGFKPVDYHLTGSQGHCLYWFHIEKSKGYEFKNVDGLERFFILPVIVLTSLFIGIGARVWK